MEKLKAILAVAAVALVVALVIFNASRPVEVDREVWNVAMTKGNPEAKKHFIMYTDIFCPYCDKFSYALIANKEDFEENYLNNNQVYFEMRVTYMNYLSGHSNNSKPAGEATYCAAKQEKFWNYYDTLISTLYDDYFSKDIGTGINAEKMPDLELDYFYAVAEKAGLELESFQTCMENHETLEELASNTAKAQTQIESGVPYFVFGNHKQSGFYGIWDATFDYEQAKLLLDAGLSS